jgi:hypothetical protein
MLPALAAMDGDVGEATARHIAYALGDQRDDAREYAVRAMQILTERRLLDTEPVGRLVGRFSTEYTRFATRTTQPLGAPWPRADTRALPGTSSLRRSPGCSPASPPRRISARSSATPASWRRWSMHATVLKDSTSSRGARAVAVNTSRRADFGICSPANGQPRLIVVTSGAPRSMGTVVSRH